MPAPPIAPSTHVRLLAYGGTHYAERSRVGAWPSIPTGTLQDLYGLVPGGVAYGCGVLDAQAFLVIRQRQNTSNRGGYAYSLLLDPGRQVWERFGWNAARLTHTILSSPASASLLLEEPERCTAQTLDDLCRDLAAEVLPDGRVPGTEDLEAVWVGALRHPVPVALHPGQAGLESLPGPGVLAGVLSRLPPCFRLGAGWLVGAGRVHGAALGARMVFDSAVAEPDAALPMIRTGRATLDAWGALEQRPEYAAALRSLSEQPVWQWPVEAGRLLEAIEALAASPAWRWSPHRAVLDEAMTALGFECVPAAPPAPAPPRRPLRPLSWRRWR